jgi:hypothetical protein
MAYPMTIEEMKDQGYKFEGDASCKKCGAAIEWWTTPRNKKMPVDHGTATPHWSSCPNADDFRADKNPAPTAKITTATLNMDWLKEQAKGCHCAVCKKITGRV